MSLMLHTSRSPDTSEIKYIHNRQTIHPHEENVWTNITGRHVKQKASLFLSLQSYQKAFDDSNAETQDKQNSIAE